MPAVTPYYMNHPKITLGDPDAVPSTEVELQCFSNNVETNIDQDETTTKTFCGNYKSYGPETWTIVLTVLQSFGTTGLWTLVKPMVGTIVPFTLLPDADNPVSEDNPLMSGTCLVKAFPFLSGAVNEPSEFDLELAVQGLPDFAIVPPAARTAETAAA